MAFVNSFGEPIVLPTIPVYGEALGLVDVSRGILPPALGSVETTGLVSRSAFGSLGLGDVNNVINEVGLGSLDSGLFQEGEGLAAMDTEGGFDKASRASLDTFNSSPAPRPGLGSLETVLGKQTQSYAALRATGYAKQKGGQGSLQTVVTRTNSSLAVLAVNSRFTFYVALAQVIVGATQSEESLGSMEVVSGDGLTVMVDLINEILYGGHGDGEDC